MKEGISLSAIVLIACAACTSGGALIGSLADASATIEPADAGSATAEPDAGGGPDAPVFLSFGTNVGQITEGEAVRIVAVLTDPQGVGDLVGGHLTSADGTVEYGAFAADRQGSYALDLRWEEIQKARPIDFIEQSEQSFVAEFFDSAGHPTRRELKLKLVCPAPKVGACGGECRDLANDDHYCGACNADCTKTGNRCIVGKCLVVRQGSASTCDEICARKTLFDQTDYECAESCGRNGSTGLEAREGSYAGYGNYSEGPTLCGYASHPRFFTSKCSTSIPLTQPYDSANACYLSNAACCCAVKF